MLYTCQCGTVINISTELYFSYSDAQLQGECIKTSTIYSVNNPFFKSALNKQIKPEEPSKRTSLDDIDYEQDTIYEDDDDVTAIDTDLSMIGLEE